MAATVFNRAWDSVLTTTIDNYKATLVDNIIKGVALTYWLTSRGRGQGIREDVGGQFIQIPVIYQKNTNSQTISGYDRYNLAPTDEATSAFERWSNFVTSVGLNLDEIQANKGASRRANLIRMKVDTMETSAKEDWERYLTVGTANSIRFISGNAGKDPVPLGQLIQKDPTVANSVHNIAQGTEAWWRNQRQLSIANAATTWPIFRAELFNMYNRCKKGSTNDGPDFGLTTQEVYEVIENGMIGIQRAGMYTDQDTQSLGYGGVKLKGMSLMWSEIMGDYGATAGDATSATYNAARGHIFFLNSRWLELVVDQDWNWAITDFEKPIDQWAVWAAMLWRGNLTVTQRRKHGITFGIVPANVSITV